MPTLKRDGVAFHYEIDEGHARPIVLIHGWCCDHTYFAPQRAYYAQRGHRVLAPDLRGHGQSDKPRQRYAMQDFADDVAWMCGELAIEGPIVMGHSMGGIVAFDLAVRYPAIPSAIVMIDSAVVRPAESRGAVPQVIAQLQGPDYQAVVRDYVSRVLMLKTDDAARCAEICNAMANAPQHVMIAAFEGLRDYDPDEATGKTLPPSLFIAADEPGPRSDLVRLQQLVPALFYGRTVGSGHFCQLEVPEQVNAMIDRFLALTLSAS